MSGRSANYGVLKAKTLAYIAANPNSTSAQAAAALGVHDAYVRSTVYRSGGKMAQRPGAPRKRPAVEQTARTSVPRLRIKTFNGTPEQYDALARMLPLEETWQTRLQMADRRSEAARIRFLRPREGTRQDLVFVGITISGPVTAQRRQHERP